MKRWWERFGRAGFLHDGEIGLVLAEAVSPCRKKGTVLTYRYLIVRLSDGEAVGRCDLRVGENAALYIAGHIGYRIDEPYRGHRYAEKACRLLLGLARKKRMKTVVITCRPDNAASRRTCERLGGRLEAVVPVPPDHDLYLQGDREECRYRIELSAPRRR